MHHYTLAFMAHDGQQVLLSTIAKDVRGAEKMARVSLWAQYLSHQLTLLYIQRTHR